MPKNKKAQHDVAPENAGDDRIVVEKNVVGSFVLELEKRFQAHMKERGDGKVVLDLTAATQIDSCGIALCVGLYKECLAKKCDFAIEASPDIYKLFRVLKLTKVITVREGVSNDNSR